MIEIPKRVKKIYKARADNFIIIIIFTIKRIKKALLWKAIIMISLIELINNNRNNEEDDSKSII